ncbi:hypothetical protein M885DRAFT_538470 [Pelagophyceae sp. CCMP2097]|nr:hypothetical protein M885DRAFT_538470 [Pelagophyceae sp. CCMP2097]
MAFSAVVTGTRGRVSCDVGQPAEARRAVSVVTHCRGSHIHRRAAAQRPLLHPVQQALVMRVVQHGALARVGLGQHEGARRRAREPRPVVAHVVERAADLVVVHLQPALVRRGERKRLCMSVRHADVKAQVAPERLGVVELDDVGPRLAPVDLHGAAALLARALLEPGRGALVRKAHKELVRVQRAEEGHARLDRRLHAVLVGHRLRAVAAAKGQERGDAVAQEGLQPDAQKRRVVRVHREGAVVVVVDQDVFDAQGEVPQHPVRQRRRVLTDLDGQPRPRAAPHASAPRRDGLERARRHAVPPVPDAVLAVVQVPDAQRRGAHAMAAVAPGPHGGSGQAVRAPAEWR